jgi:hypothetical protein
LLASLPFLLLIASVPAAEWLYAVLALLGAGAYFGIVIHLGREALTAWTIVVAFAVWALAFAIARLKPKVCPWLRLPILGFEFPFYQASILLGAVVIGLRLDDVLHLGRPWFARPWAPACLALLSLLMLRPYPRRAWVDGFVLFASLAIVSLLAPSSPMGWIVAALAFALLWRLAEWAIGPVQVRVCERLGIGFVRASDALHEWSLMLLVLGGAPLALRVVLAVAGAALGVPDPWLSGGLSEWWAGLIALLLLGANADAAGRALGRAWASEILHGTITLLL